MANQHNDTTDILLQLGAKRVLPPSKLCKRHRRGDDNGPWLKGQVILVGVMQLDVGQYFKELSYDYDLQAIKESWMGSTTYFEISEKVLEALKAHPRFGELVS
jgi:hypothetical protein